MVFKPKDGIGPNMNDLSQVLLKAIYKLYSGMHCLEKFWRISLYLTDDAIAKLFVKFSHIQYRETVENFVTWS